jgi:hypothetical protein
MSGRVSGFLQEERAPEKSGLFFVKLDSGVLAGKNHFWVSLG